jgi:hypothetical protein
MKDTMKTLVRLVLVSLLLLVVPLVVDDSPAHAQSEADAMGSAAPVAPAAPDASATSVPRAAPKYADASIGFKFEYKVDNAAVCVFWPENLQDSGCEGLDLRKLVAYVVATGSIAQSAALLRYGDSVASITVTHTPSTKTFVSQEEIDDLLNGFLVGMKKSGPATLTMSGSEPGSRYDTTEINGVDALRFEITSDAPRGTLAYATSRVVGYVLFGKHGQTQITATTDPQHMQQTREALESIVKTVRLPPLAQKGFGRTSWWVRVFDSELGIFLLVLVIAGLLSGYEYVARQKRKKRLPRR